jgi:hypothetical protein
MVVLRAEKPYLARGPSGDGSTWSLPNFVWRHCALATNEVWG